MSVSTHGNYTIVAVCGEVDLSNVSFLLEGIDEALTASPEGFAIDLSEVTYIDSAGIAAIMSAYRRVYPNGRLAVVAADRNVRSVLRLIHLEQLPGIFLLDTLADAEKALSAAT